MPVAKTYEKMEIQGEAFKESGRWYVNVVTSKGIKKVRWYSDAEYARMYPTAAPKSKTEFNARHAFGFGDEGYITIYKGGKKVEDWANEDRTNIWYNLFFFYYTPGRFPVPEVPEGIEAIRLNWEDVAAEGNTMKPQEEVKKLVAAMLFGESKSQYQGDVNEWIQKAVTVREKKSQDSRFGLKHTYTLDDADSNTYVWETGAKDYASGATVSLKMKVKEHKEINNEKVTVVWYCKEV